MNITQLTNALTALDKFSDSLRQAGVSVVRTSVSVIDPEVTGTSPADRYQAKLSIMVHTAGPIELVGRGVALEDAVGMLAEAAGNLARSATGLAPQ